MMGAVTFLSFEAGLFSLYFPVKPNNVVVNCNVDSCLLLESLWLNYHLSSKKAWKRPQPREGCFLASVSTFTSTQCATPSLQDQGSFLHCISKKFP